LKSDWGLAMASIESRIAKLESAAPGEWPAFSEFVGSLPPLDEHGHLNWRAVYPQFDETFGPWLAAQGNDLQRWIELIDPIERGLAGLLHLFNDSPNPLYWERFRGRLPDRVLAALYGSMRNWSFPPDVALRVRQLAGLVDQPGSITPGYVLHENGCITDARLVGHG
jgi:hypothetical protein